MAKKPQNEGADPIASMVRSIEKARSTGRCEGVEACLRFIGSLDPELTRNEVGVRLRAEMERRLWIPPKP